jgi:hypothetical protein
MDPTNSDPSQPRSGHPARRPLADTDHQRDADVLFNANENQNPFQGYRPAGEEEALEDDGLADQSDEAPGDEEVDGDDLEENMEDDYEARPELDRYDDVGIDDQAGHDELSLNQRLDVDQRLEREGRMRAAMQGRRAAALVDDEYDDDEDLLNNEMR